MPDGTVEIRYTEHLPDYLIHLHSIARAWAADTYRAENRIVWIKLQEYDQVLFPTLEKVDAIFLVYKPKGVGSEDKHF